jgi:hypothetical protein
MQWARADRSKIAFLIVTIRAGSTNGLASGQAAAQAKLNRLSAGSAKSGYDRLLWRRKGSRTELK